MHRSLSTFIFARPIVWLATAGALLVVSAPPRGAYAITITMEYTDEGDPTPHPENPAWDPAGTILKAHFNRAAQIWSQLLPGPGDFEFDFHWDDDIDGLGLATIVEPFDTFIEINPNYSWYADPSPATDDEFKPVGTQMLVSDLTPAERNNFFAGSMPPGALETGYHRAGIDGPVGAGGFDAADGYDLLTVVVHEMGHILGINSAHFPPKIVYGIDSQFLGGTGNTLVLAGAGGHLAGDDDKPGYLMCDHCATAGGRYYPSATDVLAIAGVNGMSDVYLPRVGRISSGLWNEPNSWIGGDTPGFPQDVYVTHGGTVTLGANASAKDLLAAAGNTLVVGSNSLNLGGNLTVASGATVSVGTGGTISANKITRGANDVTTTAGSLVWFNDYSDFTGAGGPTANFNGSIRIGNNGNTSPPTTFNPGTIVTWTIAEELAIDSGNGQISMVIDGEADFTSASGRVGPATGVGAAPFLAIDGVAASWDVNGPLAIPLGNVTVTNDGYLEANSSTIGSDLGRSTVIVQDGNSRFRVVNNLEVGPTALVGDGQGTLTLRARGRAIVGGNANIHGTSTRASEVSVQSEADLEVDGAINVGPYGLLTYRDLTFGYSGIVGSQTINNLGGANDGTGGITRFTDNSIANRNITLATSQFTNHPGTTLFATGGSTEFRDSASAGSAEFNNLPGGVNFYSGTTRFFDSATAGNGQFYNHPGRWTIPPTVEFNGNSTGGNGIFVNLPGDPALSQGGAFVFNDFSKAGYGTYTSQGEGGTVTFNDHSDAEHGTFSTADNFGGNSRILFFGDSTAGQAEFSLAYNTYLQFYEYTTAAAANIRARQGGYVAFSGNFTADYSATTTAANAQIVLDGGSVVGAFGGHAGFSTWSTAGNATITANGASVSGALGATIAFDYSAHAGNATLIANGGTNGGAGAAIYFRRAATGDTARIVVEQGALADFSGNRKNLEFGYDGTTVGSIEGAGTFALNGSELRTGTRNTNTTVSGPIIDAPGTGFGGQLIKVGIGKLTLNGANTYTGLTTVSSGALLLNGSVVGDVQVSAGATFGGSGTIGGNLNVANGGILAPGNSPGTLHTGSLTLNPASILNFEFGVVSDLMIVAGDVTLDGVLNIVPGLGFDAFGEEIITYGGTLTNHGLTIGSVPTGFSAADFQLDFSTPGEIHILGPTETVPGDYNFNGIVDAADYNVWRDKLGSATSLPNDVTPGVGQDDYSRWKSHFGQTGGSGAASSAIVGAVAPESGALLLLTIGGICLTTFRGSRTTFRSE